MVFENGFCGSLNCIGSSQSIWNLYVRNTVVRFIICTDINASAIWDGERTDPERYGRRGNQHEREQQVRLETHDTRH